MSKGTLISVARGEIAADLVLSNARIVNVFTGEIEKGNVSIYGGSIAGIGDYADAREVIDLEGRYLTPGFIDGHVHIESSMLDPGQYARAVLPHGTLTAVTDLHEIANVTGVMGLKYIVDSFRKLPLDVYLMAPSCVPASYLETSGATLDANALRPVTRWDRCIGLGEMMNFPGVLNRDGNVLGKLHLVSGGNVDGHAPGLTGRELNAYIAAGIRSEHECVTAEEGREKLARGMFLMIREGSSEKNLEALLPLVSEKTVRRCMFVVDDRTCADLVNDGDIDAVVRKAVRLGLDPVLAIQMATINPAEHFGLRSVGAVAPGYQADLLAFEGLSDFRNPIVFKRGKMVAGEGRPLFSPDPGRPGRLRSMNVKAFSRESLRIPVTRPAAPVPVIEVVPGQIVTRRRDEVPKAIAGEIIPDLDRDLLKLAVVERHKATGNIGLGLVSGFGLKKGALASSVAHDSHNIVAVGTDDHSLHTAIREVERLGGGLVAAGPDEVIASLPLPVAGLLSELPLETTVEKLTRLEKAAAELGTKLNSPFSTLSFLALPVIPEIRLTDLGMVDVREFRLIR